MIRAENGIGLDPFKHWFTLTVREPPAITSAASATFTAGHPRSFTVSSTGYPTPSLSESGGLPAGVSFVDNADGTATLSGTPAATVGGVYRLKITAVNGASPDGTQAFTIIVPGPPSVVITSPSRGGSYARGQVVRSSFGCRESAGGPGVRSCLDQHLHPSGALLDTATVGTHTLTVTAKSKNGLVTSKTVSYRVLAPIRVQISTIRASPIRGQLRLTLGGALRSDGKLARFAGGKITVAFTVRLPRGTAHGSAQATVTHGRWHVSIVLPAVSHNATHRTYRIAIRYGGDQTHGQATSLRQLRL
jgi:hypothetical protein